MTAPMRPSVVAAHVDRTRTTVAATDAERIRAAVALHRPKYRTIRSSLADCTECGHPYPCRTVRILDPEAQ